MRQKKKKGEINCEGQMMILGPNSAGCLRENVVRLRADQPDRAHHDDQDHSQHHCVLGNVLSLIVGPQVLQKFLHGRSPNSLDFAPSGDGDAMLRGAGERENSP